MTDPSLAEQIAAPFSGDNPAGTDARENGSYRRIREARNTASKIEKSAQEDIGNTTKSAKQLVTRSQSLPEWAKAVDEGCKVLSTSSKDTEIAALVIEGIARLDGFAGLADAFRWTRMMMENCWDHLYPLPDPDEGPATIVSIIDNRLEPLSRMSGVLVEPLSWIEITESTGDGGPFSFADYRVALSTEKCNEDEKEERRKQLELFEATVKRSSDDYYRSLLGAIQSCDKELEALVQFADSKSRQTIDAAIAEEKAKAETIGTPEAEQEANDKVKSWKPPSVASTMLQDEIRKCLSTVRHLTKDRQLAEPTSESGEATVETTGSDSKAGNGRASGEIDNALRTRDDAFRAILKIADFFERIEPQSLVPSQLKNVVRLAKLSPQEFFRELVDNNDLRERIFKIHGLGKPDESD